MSKSTIVYVIDDDAPIRDSVGLMLARGDWRVETHESASKFLGAVDATAKGCVVTDVCMPGISGIELLAEMKERRLDLPVVVITARGDVAMAVQAMKSGAVDFIEKPFDHQALLSSVKEALSRKDDEKAREAARTGITSRLGTLSEREKEVLKCLMNGESNKLVASELGISQRTVEVHRASVMHKMQARSFAELVRMSLIARDAH
jgi:two-component system response regulator FixJ